MSGWSAGNPEATKDSQQALLHWESKASQMIMGPPMEFRRQEKVLRIYRLVASLRLQDAELFYTSHMAIGIGFTF